MVLLLDLSVPLAVVGRCFGPISLSPIRFCLLALGFLSQYTAGTYVLKALCAIGTKSVDEAFSDFNTHDSRSEMKFCNIISEMINAGL